MIATMFYLSSGIECITFNLKVSSPFLPGWHMTGIQIKNSVGFTKTGNKSVLISLVDTITETNSVECLNIENMNMKYERKLENNVLIY